MEHEEKIKEILKQNKKISDYKYTRHFSKFTILKY